MKEESDQSKSYASATELIEKLLTTGKFSERELKRIYKILCKNTHPDLTGKDHASFIKVQDVYQDALTRFSTDTPVNKADFDPYKVIYDTGFSGTLSPRACLYICLYRYNAHDLYSFKIRTKASLQERNMLIMRSVLYWAARYDQDFIKIFVDLNTNIFRDIKTIKTIRQYSMARRLFIQGMDLFFQYQEKGRPSSKKVAEEKLFRSIQLLYAIDNQDNPMVPLAEWLIGELTLEPVSVVVGNHSTTEK
ncbi:MAG: hypothetical protein JW822_07800 [Spirochaetales bacterium]|nr:hypothetical protein [Spirochaetales bacterium]